MRLKGIGFRDAIAWLDEQDGLDSSKVVAPDDHAASRAMPVRALRLDPYAIGECAVILEFDRDVMGKVADRAARPG